MVIGVCKECKETTSISGGNRLCLNCYTRLNQRKYRETKQRDHKWQKENKERYNKYMLKYYYKNKNKKKFNADYYNNHILKIRCGLCNSKENLEYHHITYNQKPIIDVLCRECHRRLHRK